MMFVRAMKAIPDGTAVYINAAKVDLVEECHGINGARYAALWADGKPYYAALEGFGTLEDFVRILGEEPVEAEV